MDAANTLTAIDGPLFLAEPAGKPAAARESHLRLNRVTALVGGPLVELRGGRVGEMRASGLVPLDVDADECLFAAVPGAGRPLVELDGIDPADARTILAWQVRKANRYANFDAGTRSWSSARTEGPRRRSGTGTSGSTFAGEPPGGKPVGKVTFENGRRPGCGDLAALKPADAAVKDGGLPRPDRRQAHRRRGRRDDVPAPWDTASGMSRVHVRTAAADSKRQTSSRDHKRWCSFAQRSCVSSAERVPASLLLAPPSSAGFLPPSLARLPSRPLRRRALLPEDRLVPVGELLVFRHAPDRTMLTAASAWCVIVVPAESV